MLDFSRSEMIGLGDLMASIAERLRLNKITGALEELTGKECGCKERQEVLNKLFPYGIKETEEQAR